MSKDDGQAAAGRGEAGSPDFAPPHGPGDAARPTAVETRPERRLVGIPVSPGVAIGPVFGAGRAGRRGRYARRSTPIRSRRRRRAGSTGPCPIAQATAEAARPAGRAAGGQPGGDRAADRCLPANVGPSRLVRGARRRIAEQLVSAETAVADESRGDRRRHPRMPAADDDPAGRERRAEEVREIARRLVRNLTHDPVPQLRRRAVGRGAGLRRAAPGRCRPARPARMAGVATDEGGAEGHTAIMLRALGMPAVLGVAGLSQDARAGRYRRGGRRRRRGHGQPHRRHAGRGAPQHHRLRPRTAETRPAAPPAGGHRPTARRSSCRPTWKSRPSCR